MVPQGIPIVAAAHDPKNFSLGASFWGWNTTVFNNLCSPPGTPTCNPTVNEFRGVIFTVTIQRIDDTHNFAIYPRGTMDTQVNFPATPCTSPCLAKSGDVYPQFPTETLTFTPSIPADDFAGTGTYEYFCEYHPTTMHGQIKVYKSIDVNPDHVVNIIDIAIIAFAFDSSGNPPTTDPPWNPNADIDNNGKVDIIDVALAAFYFDKNI